MRLFHIIKYIYIQFLGQTYLSIYLPGVKLVICAWVKNNATSIILKKGLEF